MSQAMHPDKAPARQLLRLLFNEEMTVQARSRLMQHTYSLLRRGLVQRSAADGVTVSLTGDGRTVAQRLRRTRAGDRYWLALAQEEQPYRQERLRARLLEIGGTGVVFDEDLTPACDPRLLDEGEALPFHSDPALLLRYGTLQRAGEVAVEFVPGLPCRCHHNVSTLFFDLCDDDDHALRLDVVTGYALSEDGLWRRHTWGRRQRSRVLVETTEPRTHYFGVTLYSGEDRDEPWGNAWHFVTLQCDDSLPAFPVGPQQAPA